MNKQKLIARVQRCMGAGATRDAARAAVNDVLESLLQEAAEHGQAHLPMLGTFEYREHCCRSGAGLPGATETGPARSERRLCFRPAQRLRERMQTKQAPFSR